MRLTLQNINKSFGEKNVLNNISLEVNGGEALGLLGRNGAGKTTTIRIIMNVFPADDGEILIDGKPIDRQRIKIGYLPEERGLYPKKIIFEQLLYFARLKGVPDAEAKKAIKYWLERLEMTEYMNKRLDVLSKGNQQKIQLANTLVLDPDIIILDEPFSGLDPVNAVILKDVINERIKSGKTVFLSSHQMNYIEEFCENIAILVNGQIAIAGRIKDIKRGYDRSKIIVTSTDAENIKRFIDGDLTDIVSQTELTDQHLLVHLKRADLKNTFMNALSRFDIDEFKVYEPSLNDIFVEHTGHERETQPQPVIRD